jgi:hypothetical protein
MGEEGNQKSTVYQVQKISPSVIQVIVNDDAPEAVAAAMFQFFGIDIPIAFIDRTDFENVLVFVDLGIANMVSKIPVWEWDEFRVQEAKKFTDYIGYGCECGFMRPTPPSTGEVVLCPTCSSKGKESVIKPYYESRVEVIREWDIPSLRDAVRTKVYLKMCRGYEGFNFKGLTEDKTSIKHETNQLPAVVVPQNAAPEGKKGGWRP